MNKKIMKQIRFGEQMERIEEGRCPFCNEPIGSFRDELSRKEFVTSGLCQICQDAIYGSDEPDVSDWNELE